MIWTLTNRECTMGASRLQPHRSPAAYSVQYTADDGNIAYLRFGYDPGLPGEPCRYWIRPDDWNRPADTVTATERRLVTAIRTLPGFGTFGSTNLPDQIETT